MEYSFYYREQLELENDWNKYDLFLSVYNSSDRVKAVFEKIDSLEKLWLIIPEYSYAESEFPSAPRIVIKGKNESEQMQSILTELDLPKYVDKAICVDLTGFMRYQLLFLLYYFKTVGFKKIDFIYSEPSHYIKKEKTKFSEGSVYDTRQVLGFSGSNTMVGNNDLLIIAAGYDTNLISKAAQFKENAEVVQILGFPSLRADMYQESVLRSVAASDSFTSNTLADPIFAPASDPFETANIIEQYIEKHNCFEKYDHIYISPLSTKAQTLGIGLAYINSFIGKPVSLIYPFTNTYSKETSVGISKIWLYTVEF